MIFCLLIVKRINYFIIFNNKISSDVRYAHVGFRVVFYDRIKADWSSSYTYQAFYLLWVFWTKPSHNASSKWMIHKDSFFKSILFNNFINLFTSIVHRYIKKTFLIGLLYWFFLCLGLEKWRTIVYNFSWEFKPSELIWIWWYTSYSYEQMVFVCESYLSFFSCMVYLRQFFSKPLSNFFLIIWPLIPPVFGIFLFLSFFTHNKKSFYYLVSIKR